MKRILVAMFASMLMASGALSMASCSTMAPAPSRITIDEKALYVLELAYAGALAAAESGVDSGLIEGDRAARVDQLLQQVDQSIDHARRAYLVSDTIQAASATARAYSLLGNLETLLKG